jgi:hypothetical protein
MAEYVLCIKNVKIYICKMSDMPCVSVFKWRILPIHHLSVIQILALYSVWSWQWRKISYKKSISEVSTVKMLPSSGLEMRVHTLPSSRLY